MDGDLIGLNNSILSRSGTSSGVGFAIPAAVVRQVVEAATGGGHARGAALARRRRPRR